MTKSVDPTAFPIEFDPREQRMRGRAVHNNAMFDVPFISHIAGNLWVGGCQQGLNLPLDIVHVVSLYPWERYETHDAVQSESYNYLYDAGVPEKRLLKAIVDRAKFCVLDAPTLIHCQAGLNRSNLVATLVIQDLFAYSAAGAIELLREKRSPAVLCNDRFVEYLLSP